MSQVDKYLLQEWVRRHDEVKAQLAQLAEALRDAVEWDAYDDTGVEAVWLNKARAALKATEEDVRFMQ